MKVIVAGSRDGIYYADVDRAISLAGFVVTEIVSGTARGADSFGEQYGKFHKIPVTKFPADWDTFGKAAGYKRNAQMADYADAAIVVWNGSSNGSRHMIRTMQKLGKPVFVWEPNKVFIGDTF